MPRTNETRHIKWYNTCNCRVRLDLIIFSNVATKINVAVNIKQRKGRCNKEIIWNCSNWECECDESCNIGQFLG